MEMKTKHTLNRHTDCRECLDQNATLTAALDQAVEALADSLDRFNKLAQIENARERGHYCVDGALFARAALNAAKKARG